MSLLTAPVAKNSHILTKTYFICLKNSPRANFKVFQYKVWTSAKNRKSSYQERQILALFCNLDTLILGQNCIKDLRVTKSVKKYKF